MFKADEKIVERTDLTKPVNIISPVMFQVGHAQNGRLAVQAVPFMPHDVQSTKEHKLMPGSYILVVNTDTLPENFISEYERITSPIQIAKPGVAGRIIQGSFER
jgi:hypothetical protein